MELTDPNHLASLMKDQGLSARKLSQLVGWKSHTFMQRLLRGEVSTLRTKSAERIAEALDVPTSELFVDRLSNVVGRNVQDGDAA